MFYLTTHSTHFIYGYMASDIWLRTILIVRTETRCRHISYSYPLTARVLLYMHHPTDRITHTTAFVTPVVEHWLEREIAVYDWCSKTINVVNSTARNLFQTYLMTHSKYFLLKVISASIILLFKLKRIEANKV